MMSTGLVRQVAPCIVSHNMALGGAQTAVLRMIAALPDWVRERTTLFCQSDDRPLLDAAVEKHGFSVGTITTTAPDDPSCWVLSYGDLRGLPARPTSLILHSWDDAGFRYVTRTYGDLRGMTVAGVSRQVLSRYGDWLKAGEHNVAGLLPPPVTEFCLSRRRPADGRIVVAWMGRPLESKGLLSLPYLLALDPNLIVRAWTGADTAGLEHTRRVQSQTLAKMLKLAEELDVRDRLDLRPLDFDPFSYRHRLDGCDVLLGNSRQEGFLLTAAEALSCGIPAVVTRSCGVADYIAEGLNGRLIDWDDDPQILARSALSAIRSAAGIDPFQCLQSARDLSLAAGYRSAFGPTLAALTHTSLAGQSPRVTVAVRIHKGMRIESLDEAMSSLAGQTYRRFRTILLVDGPWEYGQALAARYDVPLLCTGLEPDITHCSALHRQAVEQCDTEFYKPLDYDDQLLPDYLERAVAAMDGRQLDIYGCLLMTLENGQFSERRWPHKPLETMFTGNSDDNMLPHSSVLMRTEICRRAGNYQRRAVGLGADDYNLWYRIHQAGGKFWRDDRRNVVYRIHEGNSLKIRRARYAGQSGLVAGVAVPAANGGMNPVAVSQSGGGLKSAAQAMAPNVDQGAATAPSGSISEAPARSRRVGAAAAAAAAIALASLPAPVSAASAPPPPQAHGAPGTMHRDDEPIGLLERWVAKVRRTGKAARDAIQKFASPETGKPHSPTNQSIDLLPPHS